MKDPRLLKADCDTCPIRVKVPVYPQWNRNPRAIILGETPGDVEVHNGRPFEGPSGKRLEKALARFGEERSSFHITNALLCQPDRKLTAAEWKQALTCCRKRLHWELKRVNSRFIIGMGAKALHVIAKKSGIFDWCGAPLPGTKWDKYKPRAKKKQHKGILADFSRYTIFSTFHPAFCLRSPGYFPIFYRHIGWALELAAGGRQHQWPQMEVDVSPRMLAYLIRLRIDGLPVGVDLETQGVDPYTSKIMCIGLANQNVAVSVPWETYVTKLHGVSRGVVEESKSDWLAERIRDLTLKILQSDVPKVYQNGPYDITAIHARLGFDPPNYDFDSLPAHALLGGRLRHDLGFIASCEGTWPRWKSEFKIKDVKGSDVFVQRDPRELRYYNAKDAWIPEEVRPSMLRQIESAYPEAADLFKERMQVMNVTTKMTWHGIKTDPAARKAHKVPLEAAMSKPLSVLQNISGDSRFSPDSPHQIKKLFLETLGLTPRYWTPTGAPCFNEEALKNYLGDDPLVDAAARAILDYRAKRKLLSTYINGLAVDGDQIMHPIWRPYQRTNRWSATPGIQTIPEVLRNIFVGRKGPMGIADWKQQELRILALFSGDEKLMQAYEDGQDIHSFVTGILYNREPDDSPDFQKLRKPVKSFNFGIAYGAAVETVYQTLLLVSPDLKFDTAQWMFDRFYEEFSGVERFQSSWYEQCRLQGYVRSPISGLRQDYMDGHVDRNEVLNFPIQSEGARMVNKAILAIDSELDWGQESISIQCHDEIVLDGPNGRRLIDLLKGHMEQTTTYEGRQMFFPVDERLGENWRK